MDKKFTPIELFNLKSEWALILAEEAIINADITDLMALDYPIGAALDHQKDKAEKNHKRKLDFVTTVQGGGTGKDED